MCPAGPLLRLAHVALVTLVGAASLAPSPADGAEAEPTELASPLKPANTGSPRETLESFISACEEIYAIVLAEKRGEIEHDRRVHNAVSNRILSCLDLSELSEFRRATAGQAAAVALKEVLDRIPVPPLADVPGPESVTGTSGGGADGEDVQPVLAWTIPDTEITIARVEEGPRKGAYLFTTHTVKRASAFLDSVGDLPYKPGATENFAQWFLSEPGPLISPLVNLLPDWLRVTTSARHALWQWIGLVAALLLCFAVMVGSYKVGRRMSSRFRADHIFGYILTLVFPVIAMATPRLTGQLVRHELRLSGPVLTVVTFTLDLLFLFAGIILVLGVGSRVAALLIANPKIHPRGLDAQFIRIVARVLSIVAAVIVFLEGGKYLGIPVTTLFASAGVGGVAVALAAQDSLKNLFGSMMIFLDKPFRVGERITTKGYDGIVEEIGLRSTKIRLLTGHQVSIPNDELSRKDIENIGRRPHIRRVGDIRVPLDSPREKLEEALAIVRDLLDDHEGLEPSYPPRVYLNEISQDAFNIRFIYWYHPPEYWAFLAQSEAFNLAVAERFTRAGIPFAPPSSVTKLVNGPAAPKA